MRKLSSVILADLVASKRKEKSMTQQALAEATGINRALISRIEKQDFIPSIPQLEQLGEVLGFEPDSVFADTAHDRLSSPSPLCIAVAGTGYVGLSIATLLAQHNHVTAVDILPEKVDLINRRKSPIQDDYIEKYLAEKDLDLTATLDGAAAYRDADYVIIAAPTNYDSARNYFDKKLSQRPYRAAAVNDFICDPLRRLANRIHIHSVCSGAHYAPQPAGAKLKATIKCVLFFGIIHFFKLCHSLGICIFKPFFVFFYVIHLFHLFIHINQSTDIVHTCMCCISVFGRILAIINHLIYRSCSNMKSCIRCRIIYKDFSVLFYCAVAEYYI